MMRTSWIGIVIWLNIFVSVRGEQSDNPTDEEGYGTEWMYFPDGDGIPQRISLQVPEPSIESRAWRGYRDIEYRLFTRGNVNSYVILTKEAEPYNETGLSLAENLSRAPVVVVTHGWMSAADRDAVIAIKDAYLATHDINVIGVDWSDYAGYVGYTSVAFETKEIGNEVAKFLDNMEKRYGVSGHRVHLIGHSLGAHVMGNAGSGAHMTIDRITGLDPARPFFEWPSRSESVKLDKSDADFVDVIHTCGGVLGVQTNIGHADFYPNQGAAPQPGCGAVQHIMEACSHGRSHQLYAESVRNPRGFPAYQCNSWSEYLKGQCHINTYMGYGVKTVANGTYYLETNPAVPFARGV